jgi:hypothetical protein
MSHGEWRALQVWLALTRVRAARRVIKAERLACGDFCASRNGETADMKSADACAKRRLLSEMACEQGFCPFQMWSTRTSALERAAPGPRPPVGTSWSMPLPGQTGQSARMLI